jgi:hypothetical protein
MSRIFPPARFAESKNGENRMSKNFLKAKELNLIFHFFLKIATFNIEPNSLFLKKLNRAKKIGLIYQLHLNIR